MPARSLADWSVFPAENVLRALPARLACARSPAAGSVEELIQPDKLFQTRWNLFDQYELSLLFRSHLIALRVICRSYLSILSDELKRPSSSA